MAILRARTVDLFKHDGLTEPQKENSEQNLAELKRGHLELNSYPRRVVLELTNACNLSCVMCGRDDFTKTFFELQYLNKLGPILGRVEEVTLFGWGEPTIHPRFREVLEFFHRYPVRKYFVTNGTTLRRIKDWLFNYRLDILAVSLDGATAETNNRIRINSDFDRIVADIRTIVQERNGEKLRYPYINFVFTLMRSNLNELPDMVNLAHDLGIEEVKAVYLTAFSEALREEILWNKAEEVRRVFAETETRGNKLGIKIKLPYIQGEDVAGDKFHKDCFVGWRDFFLGSDGYVRPCQSTSRKMFHISEYGTFEGAWNSAEFMAFRSCVNDPEKMWQECRCCYQSSHANWNKEYAFDQTTYEFSPSWRL